MKVGGNVFVRNRHQIIPVDNPLPQDLPDIDDHEEPSTTMLDNTDESQELPLNTDPSHKPSSDIEHTVELPNISPQIRRSKRNRKPPDWFTNYVPS